ncbi:MAG TPA: hypothetical protein VFT00_02010 [Nocardioides sp.]|nr:hypothetical protein [Nocardioides sp.]
MPELTRTDRGRMLRQLLVVLAVTIAAGALAGLVWEWLWTPPVGVVQDHRWLLDEAGLRDDFAGTGTYIAVAAVAGVLVGALVALLFDRAELVTLVAVVVGSVVAGWLMYRVGLAVDPPDPRVLARTAEEGAHLPGKLTVHGRSPFVAFPSGALVGLVVVFLGLSRRRPTGE